MTDEERATSILRELDVAFISYGNLHDDEEHGCKVIEKALRKTVPMKPEGDGYNEPWLCPACIYNLSLHIVNTEMKAKFCPVCGQAIDWSDRK